MWIFVDANAYMKLFPMADRRLLQWIRQAKSFIFVTQQIRDEVERNKLVFSAERMNSFRKKLPQLTPDDAASALLAKIGDSVDDTSICLNELWSKIIKPANEIIARARLRKECGKPTRKTW